MLLNGGLAAAKITLGLLAGSTAVVSDGIESGADVLASGLGSGWVDRGGQAARRSSIPTATVEWRR